MTSFIGVRANDDDDVVDEPGAVFDNQTQPAIPVAVAVHPLGCDAVVAGGGEGVAAAGRCRRSRRRRLRRAVTRRAIIVYVAEMRSYGPSSRLANDGLSSWRGGHHCHLC
jgi:hypothetical protein